MQIWLTTTEAEDGTMTRKQLARSEKEAREKAGDAANGEAQLIEIATDKDGIIALFERENFVKNILKAFDIKNGKWKSRT
jgi:hypothetical protein